MSVIQIQNAPDGSSEISISPTFGPEVLASLELNALPDGAETQRMMYDNKSGQPFAKVEVILNPIVPTGSASVQLIGVTGGYEMPISSSDHGARKVVFVDIPASFLSSFSVKNNTGAPFASAGNYVVVTPKY